MKRFAAILALLLLALPRATSAQAGAIYFDDSGPEIMRLGNVEHYEIGFRKSNGAIAYITDKKTGEHVSLGSRHECLWGAWLPHATPEYVGGCCYSNTWSNRFTYVWSATSHTLTLSYTPDPAASRKMTARVDVTASESAWFDMRLQLTNGWGAPLDYAIFPSELVFAEADIRQVLMPVLPGVIFGPAFFAQDRSYEVEYPGYPGLFADYTWLSSTKGQIAFYPVGSTGLSVRQEGNGVAQSTLGWVHDSEVPPYIPDSTSYKHTFGIRLADGSSWTSPAVRVRVGQSARETIKAFRADNGLDRLPSLAEKLGPRYNQIVRSPIYKADANQLNIPFSQYAALLAKVPVPGILHPVTFQPGGHDNSYPDFLPPDARWGTTADMAQMFRDAQARGFLVMPYTNPTWWDDESPTLQNLPAGVGIGDLAVLDEYGVPMYEHYGANGGYVMSPYPAFVRDRLARLIRQMSEDVPSDLVFEDQIGARPWPFDHNASSPGPAAYMTGWLGHTRAYSDTLLMTELAFDRLAETEIGFNGSVLLPERFGYTPDWWGTGTWRPYPLATLMARDKVLFYQHDLAPETFTVDKATLTWNLAMGYMLSYDLVHSTFGGGPASPWITLAGDFQRELLARYAGEELTDYEEIAPGVTRTSFRTFQVIANWNASAPYVTGGHTLPPQGVLAASTDGSVVGGVFTAYNGVPLSAGDHYLIVVCGLADVTVRQPAGADTSLTLALPPGWAPGHTIEARAHTRSGASIGTVPVSVTAAGITFTYRGQVNGQPIAYYRVTDASVPPWYRYLPMVRCAGSGR
jgi:hypothetical protein